MRYLLLALLSLCLAPCAATAEDYCEGTTQYEMNMCAGAKFKKAEQEMNERYATLMKRLDPEDQEKLRQAHETWLSFRQRICEFEANGLGSVRPTIFAGCLTNQTNEHIKYLDYQLTCEEGDLSCQGWYGNKD